MRKIDDAAEPPPTLLDLLRDGLDIVFVGINPSVYSAQKGHYFARPGNRFWPAFSRSTLSRAARAALGVEMLGPADDRRLVDQGFGFTDVVKRATPKASDVKPAEFAASVAALAAKLEHHHPLIACFHGLTGYRPVHRALAQAAPDPALGLQPLRIAETCLFVLPNPSGANAHFTLADQAAWYDRLGECLERIKK